MGAGTSTRDTSGRGSLGDVSPYDDAETGLFEKTAQGMGDLKSAPTKYLAEETMTEHSFQGWQAPVPGQCSEKPLRDPFEVSDDMECEAACEKLNGCRVANVEIIERHAEPQEELPRKDVLHDDKTSLPIFPTSKKVDSAGAAAARESDGATVNNKIASVHMCHLHDKCTPKPLSIVLEKQWIKMETNNGHMRCKKQDNALKRPAKTKFAMKIDECKAQCEADQGCNIVEYDNETNTCQFFASVSKCTPVEDSKQVGRSVTDALARKNTYQYKEVHHLNWAPHGMSCTTGGQKLFRVKNYLMAPIMPVYTPPELAAEESAESGSLAELKGVYKKIRVQSAGKRGTGTVLHKESTGREPPQETLASSDEATIMEIPPALPKKALHACKMNRDPSLKGPLVPSQDHETAHHPGDPWRGTSARCKFIQLNQFPNPADRSSMAGERALIRSAPKLQQRAANNSGADDHLSVTKAASGGDVSTMVGKVGRVATTAPAGEAIAAVGALPGEVSCPMYEQCTGFTNFWIHTHHWQHVGRAACAQDPLYMNTFDTQRLNNTLEKTFYNKHKKLMQQFHNDVHQVLTKLQDQDDAHEELVRAGKATARPRSVTDQEKCLLNNNLLDAEAREGANAGASALDTTAGGNTQKNGPLAALMDTEKMYLHNCLKACECNPECTAIQITRTPKDHPEAADNDPSRDGATYSKCKLFKTCSQLPNLPSSDTVVYRDPPPTFHPRHVCNDTKSDLTLSSITSVDNCHTECILDPQCQAYWISGAQCHLRRTPLPSVRSASCNKASTITAYARTSSDFSEHANWCGDGPLSTVRGPTGAPIVTHDDANACAQLCARTHQCRAFEHITFSNANVPPLCTLKKSARSAMCPQWVSSNADAHPRFFTRSDLGVSHDSTYEEQAVVDVDALNAHAHAGHAHERAHLLALGPAVLFPILHTLREAISSLWDFNPLHYSTGSHWSDREGVTLTDTPDIPIGSELTQDPDALAMAAARTKVHAAKAAEAAKAAVHEAREAADMERRVFTQNVRLVDEYAHFRQGMQAGCPADSVWPLTKPNTAVSSLCPPGSLSHIQRRWCDAAGHWHTLTSCSGMSTARPHVLRVHTGHEFLTSPSQRNQGAPVTPTTPSVL